MQKTEISRKIRFQHDYDIKYGFKSGDATTVGGYIERKAQELREDFCTRKGGLLGKCLSSPL